MVLSILLLTTRPTFCWWRACGFGSLLLLAVSYLSLQLCQPVQHTSNIFARLRKHAVVLDLTALLLQAQIEQLQTQIFQLTLRLAGIKFS